MLLAFYSAIPKFSRRLRDIKNAFSFFSASERLYAYAAFLTPQKLEKALRFEIDILERLKMRPAFCFACSNILERLK